MLVGGVARGACRPIAVGGGAALPRVGPKQAVEELLLVARGTVRETLFLRPDGGEDLRKKRRRPTVGGLLAGREDGAFRPDPAALVAPATTRTYECGEGQLVGLHAFVAGLPHHVGSAAAAPGTGCEVPARACAAAAVQGRLKG